MLLRNIRAPILMNGTKLIVTQLYKNLIECEIINGPKSGEKVLIPRIPLISNDDMLPFHFTRL